MRRETAYQGPIADVPRVRASRRWEDLPQEGLVIDVPGQRRSADQPGGGWQQRLDPLTPTWRRTEGVGRHAAERRAGAILRRAELAVCAALAAGAAYVDHLPVAGIALGWWLLQALSIRGDAQTRGILSLRRTLVRGYLAVPPVAAVGVVTAEPLQAAHCLLVLVGLVTVSTVLRMVLEIPGLRRRLGDSPTRMVLVGSPVQLEREVARFAARSDVELVGVSVDPGRAEYTAGRDFGAPVVARLDRLAAVACDLNVDQVRVLAGGLRELDLEALAWDLERTDADLVLETSLVGVSAERISSTDVGGSGVVIRTFRANPVMHNVRALADRTLAAVLLLGAAPLLLGLAAAIKMTSPGPALFRQERVGVGGKPFTIFKFRTMVIDAEERLANLVEQSDHGSGVLFKMQADPRITPLGKLLRTTSLDELPQLINVVRGDMSLVGPRPALPREVDRYNHRAIRRLVVKPGITGLWQVSGRSSLSWEESVRIDLDYVDNWTFARDLRILARTAGVVLRREGAY